MSDLPGLTGEHRAEVLRILREHLPAETAVCVFGSRAGTSWKRYSDLDLALDLGRPLPLDLLAVLREAFSESDLPWKVDLVDRYSANAGFVRIIDQTGTALDW